MPSGSLASSRLSEWRERALAGAATALKERDDRDDEIARLKSKVGEITMDNEVLYAPRSRRWRVNALWPTGGRDDEPDTLALLGSLLWHGARRAGVEDLARQRLSLSQGDAPNTIARRPGPVGACSDAELAEHIRQHIAASRLHGEGYRKLWARLRFAGVRASPRRV